MLLAQVTLLLLTQASGANVETKLAKAEQLYESLDYDRVGPIVTEVLTQKDTSIEQRLRAYFLQGSCLAILGEIVDAERPFRLLLRAKPEFELPKDTPPKIEAVFRKVQADEREAAEEALQLERSRALKELELSGSPQGDEGGAPILFEYDLKDPRGVVAEIDLHYRRVGQTQFSSLALLRTPAGAWSTRIPGEWTASDSGFLLQYYVETKNQNGSSLLTLGDQAQPRSLQIQAGTVADTTPILESFWFWSAVAAGVAGASVATVLVVNSASSLPQTDLGEVEFR